MWPTESTTAANMLATVIAISISRASFAGPRMITYGTRTRAQKAFSKVNERIRSARGGGVTPESSPSFM